MPYTLKELKYNDAWASMNDADEREYELLLQEAIDNLNISGSGDPNVAPTLRDENGILLSFEDRNTGGALDHPNQYITINKMSEEHTKDDKFSKVIDNIFKNIVVVDPETGEVLSGVLTRQEHISAIDQSVSEAVSEAQREADLTLNQSLLEAKQERDQAVSVSIQNTKIETEADIRAEYDSIVAELEATIDEEFSLTILSQPMDCWAEWLESYDVVVDSETPEFYPNSAEGGHIICEVRVSGQTPNYQWYHNEVEIEEATKPKFEKLNANADYVGTYICKIWNSGDEVWSEPIEWTSRD